MDSLTQIVLGASVGELCLGKKVGNKALLWGAVAGTIPDLDVLIKYFTDSLTANEMHRGFSHSILFSLLFAPIFGWLLYKLYQKKGETTWKDWTKLMFWGLFTHPILDSFTTWGTQLFWPLDTKVSFKNIFVVDPLYTLPFLVCTVATMFYYRTHETRRQWNKTGLIISSSYMVLTLLLKWFAFQKFEDNLNLQDIPYISIQTKPTPFNAILWTANVMQEDSFKIGSYSLLDNQSLIEFRSYPKRLDLIEGQTENEFIKRLEKLSTGWYTISKEGNKTFFNDLRFGEFGVSNKENRFVFRYQLLKDREGEIIAAEVEDPKIKEAGKMFSELWERLKGN